MSNIDNNKFKRVDDKHPLDIYIGTDNLSRPTLFTISETEPSGIISSQIINVTTGLRRDNLWGISFTLTDNSFEDIFSCFCNDIIESSRSITDKTSGVEFICDRYQKWQDMLSKQKGELLSLSSIKGLIGELYFLKEFIIPKYGQKVAIDSWIGPEKADQDFVCPNTWYEVKATVSGAEHVSITSIEQLDVEESGELVIIYLDKTSTTDKNGLTLNSLYQEIDNILKNDELKSKLSGILLQHGYFPRPEYDEPAFKFSHMERFRVDKNFPCLRRKKIPEAVTETGYYISIPAIKKSGFLL